MRKRNLSLVISEVITEAILLAFGLFIIFPHIQTVWNNTVGRIIHIGDISRFISGIWGDMNMYPVPYIVFGAIFVIWASLKGYRLWSEKRSEDEMKKAIDELPTKIMEALKSPDNMSILGRQNEQANRQTGKTSAKAKEEKVKK